MPAPRWCARWTSRLENSSKPDCAPIPPNSPAGSRPLPGPAAVIYEAGPAGYGLVRVLLSNDIRTLVAASSKLQRPSGSRVKTDAIDAEHLSTLLWLDAFTVVMVLDEFTEAARDLARAREDCCSDLMRARHHLPGLDPASRSNSRPTTTFQTTPTPRTPYRPRQTRTRGLSDFQCKWRFLVVGVGRRHAVFTVGVRCASSSRCSPSGTRAHCTGSRLSSPSSRRFRSCCLRGRCGRATTERACPAKACGALVRPGLRPRGLLGERRVVLQGFGSP